MKRYIKSAKDYGGAYDINPQALFSGEEIRDLAYEVCDIINSRYNSNFEITDIDYTPEDNKIYIEIMNSGGYTYGATFRIDMRKFRKHYNLAEAYAYEFANNFVKQIEQDNIYE